MEERVPLKNAGPIDLLERDYFLELHSQAWPPRNLPLLGKVPLGTAPRGSHWQAGEWQLESRGELPARFLRRTIQRNYEPANPKRLDEVILRFPSAPLFGIQRKREYQFHLSPINAHTLRLLRPATAPDGHSFKRIFIIFNGLNEIDHLGFYYDLAGLLMQDDQTACLFHPLPGHLTRYPMVGRYAEKPLDRFISDPSDLFRQYLRFMVENQWLLSALAPISSYSVAPGISLLEASDGPRGGRCDSQVLSEAIERAWSRIHQKSADLVGMKDPRGPDVDQQGILSSIESLRELLGWRPGEPLSSCREDDLLPPPAIHVIGYSLGGYLAQSVFFTWPFVLSSCTTLCSGGALNDLRPVKFANEEEWRSIMHGLKYELDTGMLEGRIRFDPSPGSEGSVNAGDVGGIPADYFSSHFRIFNEVFLQDAHGSYRSRVSEFAPRLLFVVGGNDPIVTTRSVMEASPSEGINLIEIANLGHFIAMNHGEWQNFWLPAVSRLLFAFSDRATTLLSQSVLRNLWNPERTGPPEGRTWSDAMGDGKSKRQIFRRESEPLNSDRFQAELNAMVDPIKRQRAFLFIARNQIPTALMGTRLLHRRGTVPHYEDLRIREYWQGLTERRALLLQHHQQIVLMIPSKLNSWFTREPPILSVKSEPTARSIPTVESLRAIWHEFLDSWGGTHALFCFDPEKPREMPDAPSFKLERMVRARTRTQEPHPVLNCLPDVWVSLSEEVIEGMSGQAQEREAVERGFLKFVCSVYEEQENSEPGSSLDPRTTSLKGWLESGKLRIIRVSGAESNPLFLGERVWDLGKAIDLLVHTGLSLARSTQCKTKNDFTGLDPDAGPLPGSTGGTAERGTTGGF
jgi:pimeloyl-ACP methyl ester carboxylesterase